MTQLKPKTILEDNLHTAKDVANARARLLNLMAKVTTTPSPNTKDMAVVAKKVIWV